MWLFLSWFYNRILNWTSFFNKLQINPMYTYNSAKIVETLMNHSHYNPVNDFHFGNKTVWTRPPLPKTTVAFVLTAAQHHLQRIGEEKLAFYCYKQAESMRNIIGDSNDFCCQRQYPPCEQLERNVIFTVILICILQYIFLQLMALISCN